MPSDLMPWVLTICLLIVAGVLVIVLRRHRARAAARLAEAAANHERALADSRAAHQREISDEQQRTTALQRKLTKAEGWDIVSRDAIVRACTELRVDAYIATNVVFLCTNAKGVPYATQLDHVVLTERGCLVVENKRWTGVVIESVQPHDVHAAIGLIVEQSLPPHLRGGELTPPFAIHIAATRAKQEKKEQHNAPLNVRFAAGSQAPVKQVRAQAGQLSTYLKGKGIAAPFFTPCVYYSHPRATVHVASASTIGTPRTPIVTTPAELRALLAPYADRGRRALPREAVDAIAAELTEIGASVRTTGRFRADVPAEASAGQ